VDGVSYIHILILRHLSKRPAHGYELRKRVEAGTGFVLHNNSLYPALRRFEEAGAVVKTSHAQQDRPARLVYELTDVGQELLHDMLAELPAEQAGDNTEFLTRLGQFEFLTPAERLIVLDARDAALAERLDRLVGLRGRSAGQTWTGLVTTELIVRAEQERGWLARLRRLAEDAGEAAQPAAAADHQPLPAEAAGGYQSPQSARQRAGA
jgi:DNA-binding PadR family transcriptional regulator